MEELKLKIPAIGTNVFHRLEPKERFFWMKMAFPTWNDSHIANIGASMAGIRSLSEYPSPKRQSKHLVFFQKHLLLVVMCLL